MGTTPNKALPYPENTDKVGLGDDNIKALALALDAELIKVIPVAAGGTSATDRGQARINLGFTFGTADPSGGAYGDVYFKLV